MKPFTKMTTAELREATKEYDRPFAADKQSRPLSADEKKLLRRVARRGRPRVGEGSKAIRITLEAELLRRADARARRDKIARSELIARGLRVILA